MNQKQQFSIHSKVINFSKITVCFLVAMSFQRIELKHPEHAYWALGIAAKCLRHPSAYGQMDNPLISCLGTACL